MKQLWEIRENLRIKFFKKCELVIVNLSLSNGIENILLESH